MTLRIDHTKQPRTVNNQSRVGTIAVRNELVMPRLNPSQHVHNSLSC